VQHFKNHGALKEAILSYTKAVKIDPGYAMAFCNLGSALQESGNPEEAIKNYERAISLKPDYAEAHNNLGVSLLEKAKSLKKQLSVTKEQ